MPQRWKSAKNADFHTLLGKASHNTATLSHISHSLDDDSYWPLVMSTVATLSGKKSLQPMGRGSIFRLAGKSIHALILNSFVSRTFPRTCPSNTYRIAGTASASG